MLHKRTGNTPGHFGKMYEIKRKIFLIYMVILKIDGQRWYTANVVVEKPLQNIKYQPIFEDNYTPVKMFQKVSFKNISEPINSTIGSTLKPVKMVASVTVQDPEEDDTSTRPYHDKPLPKIISYNRTLNNINVLKVKPKRKIVRRCPTLRPMKNRVRQKKQLTVDERGRFLDVFHVVEFQNNPCTASSGVDGVCLHQYECSASGGVAMGECADGFGTCCVSQFTCGESAAAQVSWFVNPEFPSPNTERLSCAATVDKLSEDITQIRLDFMSFELLPPTDGACEQDQFVVSGQNINNIIPILCGINNGQHLYIEVGSVAGPIYLSLQTVADESRLFAIKVTQLTASDELAAPTGCLQHHRDHNGYLESFNYQDKSNVVLPKVPSYLNNLNYGMCIERASDSCSVTYSNTGIMEIYNYDLDGLPLIPVGQAGVEIFNCPSDWLLVAAARLCGDRLNDGSVFQDFSLDAPVTDMTAGPIVVWFRTDSANSGRGFRIQYQQNPCLSPA